MGCGACSGGCGCGCSPQRPSHGCGRVFDPCRNFRYMRSIVVGLIHRLYFLAGCSCLLLTASSPRCASLLHMFEAELSGRGIRPVQQASGSDWREVLIPGIIARDLLQQLLLHLRRHAERRFAQRAPIPPCAFSSKLQKKTILKT